MANFRPMRPALRLHLAAVTDNSEAAITAPSLLLMDSGHDFDASAAAEFVADLPSGDEAAPTGYARQPVSFAGAISIDSNGRAVITLTDTAFGNLGGAVDATIGGGYIFDDTGDDATSRLLYAVPASEPQTTDGGAFTVRWFTPTLDVRPS